MALSFTEEGFTHIENGIRVAEFNKIDRAITKRIVMAGMEIGFKYSGQPVTCQMPVHRAHGKKLPEGQASRCLSTPSPT